MSDNPNFTLARICAELSSVFFFASQSYGKGESLPRSTVKQIADGCRTFLASENLIRQDVGAHDAFVEIVRKVLPVTCIPAEFESIEEFCDNLIIALSAHVVVVEKKWFDETTEMLGKIAEVRKEISIDRFIEPSNILTKQHVCDRFDGNEANIYCRTCGYHRVKHLEMKS